MTAQEREINMLPRREDDKRPNDDFGKDWDATWSAGMEMMWVKINGKWQPGIDVVAWADAEIKKFEKLKKKGAPP